MDIVSVNPSTKGRSRRLSERRHTTEVRYEQLPSHHTLSQLERDSITSLSSEDLSPRGDNYHHPVAQLPYSGARSSQGVTDSSSLPNGHQQLASSWGPQCNLHSHRSTRDRSKSIQYFKGSQVNMFGEGEFPDIPGGGGADPVGVAGHQYQLSYELALDNVLTPFANPAPISTLALASITSKKPKLSDNPVMEEVIATEMSYVRDVREIIKGYLCPLHEHVQSLPVSAHQINTLFGNIKDIRDFHSALLDKFLDCNGSVGKLGECFLHRVEQFKTLYTHYCNHYPDSLHVLAELSKVSEVSAMLKSCQQQLHHLLPLGAYLLKPVQRILRYHLLLTHMVKKTSRDTEGFSLVEDALCKMTEVAEHINAMKKKYDTAIHVQEILSLIRGIEVHTLDLTKYGDLVLEDSFRYSSGRNTTSAFRSRTERYVFLFQRLYLVTKKEEDGGFQYKMHVEMKDLQLTERVEKEPACFQIRQVSTGRAYTFQARHEGAKEEWTRKIKLLLVESIPDLPDKARMLIMRGFEVHTDSSREMKLNGSVNIDKDLVGVVRKTQSLDRHASPQLVHLHGSPPLGVQSKGTRHRNQTSPVPVRLKGTSLVKVTRSNSPSQDFKSKVHTEVVSEVQYQIGATYSPKRKSSINHQLPSEEEMCTDSGGSSSEGYSGTEATPTYHSNGVDHAHHFSSPPAMDQASVPAVPSLFGRSHAAVHEMNELEAGGHMTSEVVPELDPPPGFGSLEVQTVPSDVVHHGAATEAGGVRTDRASTRLEEGETLFNELMSSSSPSPLVEKKLVEKKLSCMDKKVSSTDLDWGGSRRTRSNSFTRNPDALATPTTPPTDRAWDHIRSDSSNTVISDRVSRSSSMDEGSTPKASPYTSPSSIRRWSVKKRRSYDHSDPDEVTTPMTSPYIRRHHSANLRSTSSSSVGSENSVFSPPILDPPTPFRNPAKVERLGPFPDENLEALEADPECEKNSKDKDGDSTTSTVEEASKTKISPRVSRANYCEGGKPRPKTLPPDISFRTSDIAALAVSESQSNAASALPPDLKKSSGSKVKRSHSFGSNKRLAILHKREGSQSTNNSPLPTPKFRSSRSRENLLPNLATKVRQRKLSKGSSSLTAVPPREEQGTSDVPQIHVDVSSALDSAASSPLGSTHSLIIPPPAEFKCGTDYVFERSSSRASSTGRDEEENGAEKEERSLFSFFRIKHHKRGSRSATPSDLTREDKRADFSASVTIPVEHSDTTPTNESPQSSSNDMLSFDEALESYDQYASHSGKTARSAKQSKTVRDAILAAPASLLPPPSPSSAAAAAGGKKEGKKKKKNKKKRHGYTVANIDSDTMREVHRSLAEREDARQSSDSRVHQLAREYSQKIKDRSKLQKKYSMVFEEDDDDSVDDILHEHSKPEWLARLSSKKRQSSTGNLLDSSNTTEDDDRSSTGSTGNDTVEPHPFIRPQNQEDVAGAVSHVGGADYGSRGGPVHAHQRHTLGHLQHHRAWVEEEAKTGRLKGWVRSIAAKFAKKEATTL